MHIFEHPKALSICETDPAAEMNCREVFFYYNIHHRTANTASVISAAPRA